MAYLAGAFMFVLSPIIRGEAVHWVYFAVAAVVALIAALHYRDQRSALSRDNKEWRIHNTEWELRQARSGLESTERRLAGELPGHTYLHYDDPTQAVADDKLAVLRWKSKTDQLEVQLQRLMDEQ